MKANYRSPKIKRLVEQVRKMGWTVEFVDFCEDAETPGMLGQFAGVCCRDRCAIKVRTNGMTRQQIAAILEHEIEHALGADKGTDYPHLGLRCGGLLETF